jgi:hypothetical protein
MDNQNRGGAPGGPEHGDSRQSHRDRKREHKQQQERMKASAPDEQTSKPQSSHQTGKLPLPD